MKKIILPGCLIGFLSILMLQPAVSAPDYWDPRLTTLGVYYTEANVPNGQYYWRLVSAVFLDEHESGGTHHVYYKTLNEAGNPIANQKCWLSWPTSNPTNAVEVYTKGPGIDDYWGNTALYGGWCPFYPEGPRGPYGAYVDGQSDQVWGMGLPCNRHVSYRLTWRWTQKTSGIPTPAIEVSPASLTPSALQGSNASTQSFTIRNSGSGTLNYSIQTSEQWLSVSPTQGTSTGELDQIMVSYQTSALSAGVYNANLTVSDPAASNNPQTLPVTLTISGLTGVNLLNNPSFEASGGSTIGWVGDLNTIGNNYPHPGGAREGTRWVGSSCGYGSGTRTPEIRQTVAVVPGRTYQVSAWVNTAGSPNTCSAYLQWFNGPDPGSNGQCTTLVALTSNTSGWQKLTAVVQPTGNRLTICIRLSWDCSGAGGGGNVDMAEVLALSGDTVAQAKMRANNQSADVIGKTVTAVFPNHFYIQEADRSSGLMVQPTTLPAGITPGWAATASGLMQTSATGERFLSAIATAASGSNQPYSLGMSPARVGGADWYYQSLTGAGQRGITGASGLNNISLLISTWGRIVSPTASGFYLDAGDGTQLRCVLPAGVSAPPAGTFVIVTGISSCENAGGQIRPLLKVRSAADILGL